MPEAPATPDGRKPSRPKMIKIPLASITTAPARAVRPPMALPPLAIKDRPETDRWVLALLNQTIRKTTEAMNSYDAKLAGETIESFVNQLSNWYIRRNRRRFWKSTDLDDKRSAYLTLFQCLNVIHRLMAPFVPFLAENVYQNLIRNNLADAPISVHMTTWPKVESDWEDEKLLFEINVVQKVVGLARAARNPCGRYWLGSR